MKKLILSSMACAGMLVALAEYGHAHGGRYRGPGDVVPPNAGGGNPRTGGPKTPGPVTPGPSAPGAPAPAGPTTPGPGAPPPPTTGGPGAPSPTGGPITGPRGIRVGADLSKWQFWWEFNKDPYINLKESIHKPATKTGSDEFFMGSTKRVVSKDTAKPSMTDIQEVILPALKRALETSDNRDINSSCMIALAKIGQDPSDKEWDILSIFKKNLETPDQEIRETAALAMGISRMVDALKFLIPLASDSTEGRKLVNKSQVDNRTRSFAAYGLGLVAYAHNNVDTKRAVFDCLSKILVDRTIVDRNILVAAINGIGLLKLDTKSSEAKEKQLLTDVLKALDDYYAKELGRGRDMIQSHVPPAIAKLLGRGSDDLRNAYKAKYAKELTSKRRRGLDIYRAAALALGQLVEPAEVNKDDENYSKMLLTYFKNGKDHQAKYFCLLAMGQIGGTANKNELLKILSKGRKALEQPWAAISLGVLDFDRFEKNPTARPDITLGIALTKQLKVNKNRQSQSAFAVALGLCRYKEAAGDIMDLLVKYKSDEELAGYLCIGLALMDYQRAKGDIHEIVRTSVRRHDLLKQAATALGKLGDKTVTNTLTEMLHERDPNLAKLSAIASALGFIGDRRTIAPLRKMLFDDSLTPLSRAFAAVAMGGVADKETLPWNSKIARNMNYRAAVETLTGSGSGILDIL